MPRQPASGRVGTRAPAAEKVVERIAATRAETIVTHGAAAANALGLTTQVPTKLVYLTSGPSRKLWLGAQVIEMKHAPQWMLLPSQPEAGEAVRALAWLGQHRASQALTVLKEKLPSAALEHLVARRPALPAWMSKSISQTLVPMPESYLALSRADRLEALGVAATASGRPVHLLEKDIWVVWALQFLFVSH